MKRLLLLFPISHYPRICKLLSWSYRRLLKKLVVFFSPIHFLKSSIIFSQSIFPPYFFPSRTIVFYLYYSNKHTSQIFPWTKNYTFAYICPSTRGGKQPYLLNKLIFNNELYLHCVLTTWKTFWSMRCKNSVTLKHDTVKTAF